MLSFIKLCRQSRVFKFSFFNKFLLSKITRDSNYYQFNNHYCLSQFKSFSTVVDKDKVIPLEEISNFTLTHKNLKSENLPLLLNEISKHKENGKGLPQYISLIDVRDILECETPTQRSKYLIYLFKKEQIRLKSKEKKLKDKIEREKKRIEMEKNAASKSNNHIEYGLGKNTLILRTLRRSFMKFYDTRLANAALFGQKIVIDFGYDKLMSKKEKKACISQVKLLYSANRLHRDPYDLYFCNAGPESRCVEYLRHEMPNLDQTLATLTEQSYLELFPKENLVYLSPHSTETLSTYDHKAVYIIGGFVDTVKREDVSYFKALEEGIKCYKLPLDEFVAWGSGSRSLTINQVFSILQTMRDTGDWKEAFKHLPIRKLKRIDENSHQAELYSDKLYVINNA